MPLHLRAFFYTYSWYLLTILLVAVAFTFYFLNTPKIGHIRSPELFEKFQYKKELEAQLKLTQSARKQILDSLQLRLEIMRRQFQTSASADAYREFEQSNAGFQQKKQEFEEDDEQLIRKYNEEIWNQLNQYIQEYAEKEGYDYILGADGSGVLMAADKSHDLTEELINYCNKKYEGQN